MPWKKTNRKSSWKRRPSLAKAVARKAPRKYHWAPLLDTPCGPQVLPARVFLGDPEFPTVPAVTYDVSCSDGTIGADPADPVNFVLVPPAEPYDVSGNPVSPYESDNITIVRLEGYIKLMPYYVNTAEIIAALAGQPPQLADVFQAYFNASRHYFFRAGLKKDQWLWNQVTAQYEAPVRDPYNTQDWSDGQFMKLWTREKMLGELGSSSVELLHPGAQLGCCPDVTGAGGGTSGFPVSNNFTNGTGIINIDDIDIATECNPCYTEPETLGQVRSTIVNLPERPLYLGLNSRRRLTLKENEGLSIWMNYAHPKKPQGYDNCIPIPPSLGAGAAAGILQAVGWLATAHVRALIET